MDAGFIHFRAVGIDNFVDVVDGNHEIFTPGIINSINNKDKDED